MVEISTIIQKDLLPYLLNIFGDKDENLSHTLTNTWGHEAVLYRSLYAYIFLQPLH